MILPCPTAAQLLQERPPNWEYRLTALWLREGFAGVDQQLADLKRGAIFRPSAVLTPAEFLSWAGQKADDVATLAGVVATVLADDLTQPGDPARIRQAVDRLIEVGEHLVEWEIEVHFARVDDDAVQAVKALMSGWAEDVLRQIESLPALLEQVAAQAAPGSRHELTLTFTRRPRCTKPRRGSSASGRRGPPKPAAGLRRFSRRCWRRWSSGWRCCALWPAGRENDKS